MFCLRTLVSKGNSLVIYNAVSKGVIIPAYISKCHLVHETVNKKLESILKKKDQIPDEYKIVYRAPLFNYLKITYLTVVLSSGIIPFIIASGALFDDSKITPYHLSEFVLIRSSLDLAIFTCGLVFIGFGVCKVVFSYPLRVYSNPSNGHYIAIYQHKLPLRDIKEEFQAGDLKKVEKSWLPWKDSLYYFRKRRAIFIEGHFQRPIDLDDMMTPMTEERKQ